MKQAGSLVSGASRHVPSLFGGAGRVHNFITVISIFPLTRRSIYTIDDRHAGQPRRGAAPINALANTTNGWHQRASMLANTESGRMAQ